VVGRYCGARRTGCDARARNFAELRVKLYDIKDFPTEGIFFADITTLLEDARPSGTGRPVARTLRARTRRGGGGGGVARLPSSRSASHPRLWPARYGASARVLASAPQSGRSERV